MWGNVKETAEDMLMDKEETPRSAWEATKDTFCDVKDSVKEKAVDAKDFAKARP